MLKMDGYDECVIGICQGFGGERRIAYDVDKIIQNHMSEGMSEEEAYEFFEFNQIGAYVGETGPVFIDKMTLAEIEEVIDEEC